MRRAAALTCAVFCMLAVLYTTAEPEGGFPESRAAGILPAIPDSVAIDLHKYIWPTDASNRITSSFAEYRTTHFHGGIDISTNHATGYKVFAVNDGYIYRIAITANGYGKMLYVRHPDGIISTYAHLMTFNSAINAVVRKEQLRRGTYAIDYLPSPREIPVRQGDVIAYTGNTGFGPPHLHFELRDSTLDPVNPLRSPVYRMPDRIPPVITRLMVTPIGYGSTVEDGSAPRFYSRFPVSRHIRYLPGSIRIHGDIGIGVEAQDKSDGSWSKEGIYRLELFIDDSCTYRMDLDRVPAERTKLVDLHYDLQEISEGHGRFQKLYVDDGNDLPFYHQPHGTGIIHTEQLTEGPHDFLVVCTDNSGNRTELRGTLFANHRPVLSIAQITDGYLTIGGKDTGRIAAFTVYGKRSFQTNWTKHSLSAGRFERTTGGILLPVNTKPYEVVKIIAETRAGSESPPLFYFLKKPFGPSRSVHIQTDILHDYVRFVVTTPGVFTSIPSLTVLEGGSRQAVDLVQTEVNTCTGSYTPSLHVTGTRSVKVEAEVNGKPAAGEGEFTVYPIPPDRAGSWSTEDGGCTVTFDSGAVFKPLFVEVTAENSHDGTLYSLEPQDILLNKGIRVSVTPRAGDDREHRALYFRANGGWLYQTSARDSGLGSYSTTITRTLGEFCFMEDDSPPSISRFRCSASSGVLNARFRYFDNLSGIDPDEIKMYLDDTLVIPEIDGEHRIVYYAGDSRLDRGKHTLRISIRDRASNPMTVSRTVTVR